jgi:hypothetical protein
MNTVLRVFVLLAVLVPSAAQQAPEASRPIERENLIEALKTGQLPEQKAIEVITRQKLNFIMTAGYADDFRKLGAGETLIYTLWKNDAYVVKKGSALTKDEIVTLLGSGVPSPRVERIIEVRKARLVLDGPASKEIVDAGGSATLLGVILTNLVEKAPEPLKNQIPGEEDSVALIMNINQRSASAAHKTAGPQVGDLDAKALTVLQLLKEYGYTPGSLLWRGDFDLILKTWGFTHECVERGLIKSDGKQLQLSMELSDPEAAVGLLMKTFTPAERAAIQCEITCVKLSVVDDRRETLLKNAGYNVDRSFRLAR